MICGTGCKYQEGTAEQSKTYVWCLDGTCPSNGGTCHLFRRELERFRPGAGFLGCHVAKPDGEDAEGFGI